MSSKQSCGTTLLLVDVQKDFHPGGSLAIPDANEDAGRIAEMIRKHGRDIDRIVATLDSHHKLHIAHPCFWESDDPNQRHPPPFTVITTDDILSGKWKPRPDLKLPFDDSFLDPNVFAGIDRVVDSDNDFNLTMYCVEYTRQLEAKGRFQLCIWPEHCLIGTTGHCVVDNVRAAMDGWSAETGGSIEWVLKGQSLLTEMYSALQADVPLCASTSFNHDLMKSLLDSDRLLVCGQAISHCVNYTLRDIVDHWPKEQRSKICLLTDCASAVPGFESSAHTFLQDMKVEGVQLCTSVEAFPS